MQGLTITRNILDGQFWVKIQQYQNFDNNLMFLLYDTYHPVHM